MLADLNTEVEYDYDKGKTKTANNAKAIAPSTRSEEAVRPYSPLAQRVNLLVGAAGLYAAFDVERVQVESKESSVENIESTVQ